jgi:hypothetical protein
MKKARFGGYQMEVDRRGNVSQVSVYDLSNLRFPLMWSKTMTNSQAEGAIALFQAVGYFAMPKTV